MEVKELSTGDSFGELALISLKPRASSILCKEDCHLAFLEKKGFEEILLEFEKKKITEGLNFMSKIRVFNNISPKSLISFYYGLFPHKFMKGNRVYAEETQANSVFFIKEGEFLVFFNKFSF